MPKYSHKYSKMTLVCEDCGDTQETFAEHNEQIGDSGLACLICDGIIMITQIEHHIIPQHCLVECDCGIQDIASFNVISSNRGWVCPKCGADEHGKGGGHHIYQDIFYNEKQSTKFNDLILTQTSLDIFSKPCCGGD